MPTDVFSIKTRRGLGAVRKLQKNTRKAHSLKTILFMLVFNVNQLRSSDVLSDGLKCLKLISCVLNYCYAQ
jgi:hypothetical protein